MIGNWLLQNLYLQLIFLIIIFHYAKMSSPLYKCMQDDYLKKQLLN
jgi:hypothetical protein